MLDHVSSTHATATSFTHGAAPSVKSLDVRAFTELMNDQAQLAGLGQVVKDLPRDMSRTYEALQSEWNRYGQIDPMDPLAVVKSIEIQAGISSASLRFYGMTSMVKGVVDAFTKLINTTS